jgi:hypothetical protein
LSTRTVSRFVGGAPVKVPPMIGVPLVFFLEKETEKRNYSAVSSHPSLHRGYSVEHLSVSLHITNDGLFGDSPASTSTWRG